MSDSMQVDWAMMVKQTINEKPLAEAGYELARIVAFALKTQHDAQFARDVDACVKSFWARCERERDATPSPVGASVPVPSDLKQTLRMALRDSKEYTDSIDGLDDGYKAKWRVKIDTALAWLERQGQG